MAPGKRGIRPAPTGSSVLVFALSGLGKSHLTARYPEHIYDSDTALEKALRQEFGGVADGHDARALFIQWRRFARSEARRDHRRQELQRWARVRRHMHREILGVLTGPQPVMVLTNLICIPWYYSMYYGIVLGRYVEHFELSGRPRDNEQIEEKNSELEGYEPLLRMSPGSYLGQRPEIIAWLEQQRRRGQNPADGSTPSD